MSERLLDHYGAFDEAGRLDRRAGLLEEARTRELIDRYLPPGASVLDVGGGDGRYAEWLARKGHDVQLVDAVPRHVEQARARAGSPLLFTAGLGDARTLTAGDDTVDAVLLLGPLYHLVERADRIRALREARRVCRPGGVVIAAVISRLAPALDGLLDGWIVDPHKFRTVELQLEHGASGDHQEGFPAISTFHDAAQVAEEAHDAGLTVETVLGIQGPGWFRPDFEEVWRDAAMRERILWLARTVEAGPAGLTMSPHLLLVAHP